MAKRHRTFGYGLTLIRSASRHVLSSRNPRGRIDLSLLTPGQLNRIHKNIVDLYR